MLKTVTVFIVYNKIFEWYALNYLSYLTESTTTSSECLHFNIS